MGERSSAYAVSRQSKPEGHDSVGFSWDFIDFHGELIRNHENLPFGYGFEFELRKPQKHVREIGDVKRQTLNFLDVLDLPSIEC